MPHDRVHSRIRARSKDLKGQMSPPERRLWHALRAHRFLDHHFRRQAPMGDFIADFVCHAQKLVVELDGWTHGGFEAEVRDGRRDSWFESRGYRVLRIPNELVSRDLETVLRTIEAALDGAAPPSLPSPARGREERARLPESPND